MLLCSFRGLFETSDMFESTLLVPRKEEVQQVQCSGSVPEPCLNPEEGPSRLGSGPKVIPTLGAAKIRTRPPDTGRTVRTAYRGLKANSRP